MSSTVTESLPPEGHGGHLGGGAAGLSPLMCCLACAVAEKEGAPGSLIPRPPCPSLRPDLSHRDLARCFTGVQPWVQLHCKVVPTARLPPSWLQGCEVGGFTSFHAFGDSPACPSPWRPWESGCPSVPECAAPLPWACSLLFQGQGPVWGQR